MAEQASATEQVNRSSNGIDALGDGFSVSKEAALRIISSLMAPVPNQLSGFRTIGVKQRSGEWTFKNWIIELDGKVFGRTVPSATDPSSTKLALRRHNVKMRGRVAGTVVVGYKTNLHRCRECSD
jgi:hypothetical protein